jgi:hypothetical protein
MKMEAGGGLVKDEEHFCLALFLAEVVGQLHPLALTAGEG